MLEKSLPWASPPSMSELINCWHVVTRHPFVHFYSQLIWRFCAKAVYSFVQRLALNCYLLSFVEIYYRVDHGVDLEFGCGSGNSC
jgi:hypothetical protein